MMNDYEDPAAAKLFQSSWEIMEKNIRRKEKLIVDSHNVNIVVKR